MESANALPLDNLLRLKAALLDFKQQNHVTDSSYPALSLQLDLLLQEAVDEWPTVGLDELVAWSEEHHPQLDLTVYKQVIQQQQISEIIGHHFSAKRAGEKQLVVSHWFPDVNPIPLNSFSWNQTAILLEKLFDLLKNPNHPFVDTVEACHHFFGSHGYVLPMAGLSAPSNTLIRSLIESKTITTFDAPLLIEDVFVVKEHMDREQKDLNFQFHAASLSIQNGLCQTEALHALLTTALATKMTGNQSAMLEALLINWQGPGKASLLDQWLNGTFNSPQRRKGLIAACTGIEPKGELPQWRKWVETEAAQEQTGQAHLAQLIQEEQLYYDIAFMLSCKDIFSGGLEHLNTTWQPVLHALSNTPEEDVQEVQEQDLETEAFFEQKSMPELAPEREVLRPLEDDIDHFEAPPKVQSESDRVVEQQSTWNLYLKPFLSENWLGLIGVSSLMVAWLFLSMWIWDKGQYYRLAAGAIPMLVVTLGAGWITQFFHKLESRGTSRKAVELFACLTLFSLPFNFLIDASLLGTGDTIGFILSGAALCVHLAVIGVLLGRWLQVPFGINLRRYFLESSVLLILPTLVSLYAPAWQALSLSLVVFLAYGAVIRGFIQLHGVRQRFSYLALGSHFVLAVIILHIYHFTLPDPVTVAVLIELVALTLIFLFPGNASIVVAGGALSALGHGIGFIELEVLPFTLILAGGFWLKLRHSHAKLLWVNDVILLHVLSLALVLFYILNAPLDWLPLMLLPAVLIIIWFEHKYCQTKIPSLSLLLPLYMVVTALSSSAIDMFRFVDLALLLLTGGYCYLRYSLHNQLLHWFVAILLMVITPVLLFHREFLAEPSLLCWYWSTVAIGWAMLSAYLKDLLTYQHRTTLLWGLAVIATVCQAIFLVNTGFDLQLTMTATLTSIALFFAAKRASSSLPVYLLLTLTGGLAYTAKQHYQIVSSSGIGISITACGLLLLARYLPRFDFFHTGKKVDRFFSSYFVLRTTEFVSQPLTHIALLLIAASMVKAAIFYAPTIDSWQLSLSMLIQAAFLTVAARQYHSKLLAILLLLPATGLFAALVLSLPLHWIPIAIVAGLLLFSFTLDWLNMRERDPIRDVLNQYHQVLMLLSIPCGIVAYLLMLTASPVYIGLYGMLIILLNHIYLYIRKSHKYCHVTLVHLIILWTLAYLFYADIQTLQAASLLPWLLGCTLILSLLGVASEGSNSFHLTGYGQHVQAWLFFAAQLFAALVIQASFIGATNSTLMIYAVLAIPLLIMANRAYQRLLPIIMIGGVSITIGYLLTADPLWTLVLALPLFAAIEMALLLLSRASKLPIHAQNSNADFSLLEPGYVLYGLVIMALIGHMATFLMQQSGANLPHYMLYLLIPFVALLYKILRFNHLAYAAIGLFAYGNCFMSLELLAWMNRYDLTVMHLLSGAMAFSLLCFTGLGRVLALKEVRI